MDCRILKAVPETDLRVKMDAMVHDLTQALEETSCQTSGRLSVGIRRRTRSAGNIKKCSGSGSGSDVMLTAIRDETGASRYQCYCCSPLSRLGQDVLLPLSDHLNCRTNHSDDSISERLHTRSKEMSSLVQSDSDEVSATSQRRAAPYPLQKRPSHLTNQACNFESDSVNENFSPLRTGVRRKRKMKRMDLDPIELVSPRRMTHPPVLLQEGSCQGANMLLPGPVPESSGLKNIAKKKKIPLPKDVDRFDVPGKRKRGVRCPELMIRRHCKALRRMMGDPLSMPDRELMSSSSLSSESDGGLQTNDEGGEGDDEQSDWVGEGRGDEETDLETDDPTLHILNTTLSHMTAEARQAYTERVVWLKGDINRERRGGRRRVHGERPHLSVLTSGNEKLSRFLQDCETATLRLHPMDVDERERLRQFVDLYSLRMRVEESCPVLSKTSATPRSIQIDPDSLCINDYKKRRKLPQNAEAMDIS